MMDPLSVSMAIVGLLTAAQQISSAIGTLVSKSKSAPKEIQSVRSTVDTIRTVLLQLQMLLLGRAKINRQRTSLILVEQVVITLSACVATFSELDVFIGTLDNDNQMGLMDRIRWATKTSTIQEHMQKLEMHKSSLILMMTILTCESTYKAEDAVDELSGMIQKVLDSHQVLAQRLLSIEIGIRNEQPLTSNLPETNEVLPEVIQRNSGGFAFEEVLENSWVYKRSTKRGDDGAFSVISAAGRTASWSMLSGLSLSDNISIIAVQALPVYAHDISNSDVYQFGEFNDSGVAFGEAETETENVSESSEPRTSSFRKRLGKIAASNPFIRPRKSPTTVDAPLPASPPMGIFGVPLVQSITYANVAISLVDAEGMSYIYGYIPIVVAKVGVYIKEKGTDVPNIFAQSGSAKRIHALQIVFDSPDRYGKGFDWVGNTVYDAASCMLRYLKLLPEPIVPYALYDQFASVLPADTTERENLDYDQEGLPAIRRFQQLVTEMPPLNRMLLLYLLDTLAVFASKADQNLMTSQRLVAAFQPALLSREPSAMSADDHVRAADTMIFMVENQDHFLIGMRGTAADEGNGDDQEKSVTKQPSTAESAVELDSREILE